jgi:nucleotide-binding universal stress UspA family protein
MGTLKKILAPVDLSEPSLRAVARAEEIARSTGAELVLLHVLDEVPFIFAGDLGAPLLAEEFQHAVSNKLSDLEQALRDHGISVRTKLVRGKPHDAIVKASEEEHPDLVIIGTHGRSGLSHLFLGSVAERVVRTLKEPVMTVRA